MQTDAKFSRETITVDGMAFSRCEFTACRLVYAGGEPPQFEACRFDDCEWKFSDGAAGTLTHLRSMWLAGAKPAVQSIIKDITVAGR